MIVYQIIDLSLQPFSLCGPITVGQAQVSRCTSVGHSQDVAGGLFKVTLNTLIEWKVFNTFLKQTRQVLSNVKNELGPNNYHTLVSTMVCSQE